VPARRPIVVLTTLPAPHAPGTVTRHACPSHVWIDPPVTVNDDEPPPPAVLLVDAANVVGSRPTGWWKDRPGAARSLVARLRQAPPSVVPRPAIVVLEGVARRGADEAEEAGVRVVHATGEGDDTIAALAGKSTTPVCLVSADRRLADRVRRVGGDVVGPSSLLRRLDR
jgi:hypothetical protein